jgi:hypothetical protein
MSIVNWVINSLAGEDIIDLYFILSDLVEIDLSEAEIYESASYDSLASSAVSEYQGNGNIPIGKLVI